MQKEAEAEAKQIRGDAARAPEERRAILLAMRAETEKSISGVLGPRVFKVYQKHHGTWLSRFAEDAR
jgi:hypothetical protein